MTTTTDFLTSTQAEPVRSRSSSRSFASEQGADVATHQRDDTVRSIVKAIAVLDCFSTLDRQLSVAEIAKRIGVPRGTAHRIATTLWNAGLLERERDREHFRLGLKLFEYGTTVLANLELQDKARPFIEALTKVTGLIVHLSVFDGERATIIKRGEPNRDRPNTVVTIESAPCHVTSTGKAILAFQPADVIDRIVGLGLPTFTHKSITQRERFVEDLAEVRIRGYAIDDEEHEIGIRCVGAPIRNVSGRVFASLSVSGNVRKFPESQTAAMASLVMQYAAAISAQLGYVAPTTDAADR